MVQAGRSHRAPQASFIRIANIVSRICLIATQGVTEQMLRPYLHPAIRHHSLVGPRELRRKNSGTELAHFDLLFMLLFSQCALIRGKEITLCTSN